MNPLVGCPLPCRHAWTKMANFAVILQISRTRWIDWDLVVLHCVGWTSTTRRRRCWGLLWLLLQCKRNDLCFESDPIYRHIVRFPRSWWILLHQVYKEFNSIGFFDASQLSKNQDLFCVSGGHLEDQLRGSVANYNDVSWVESCATDKICCLCCSCDSCPVVHCIDLVAWNTFRWTVFEHFDRLQSSSKYTNPREHIMIITLYKPQAALLEETLRKFMPQRLDSGSIKAVNELWQFVGRRGAKSNHSKPLLLFAFAWQVVTVDASQGSEAPHIILSTVRSRQWWQCKFNRYG